MDPRGHSSSGISPECNVDQETHTLFGSPGVPAIVVDFGTSMTKAGFGGEDNPRAVYSTVVGRPRHPRLKLRGRDSYVGDEAQWMRILLSLRYPIENGVVINWDDMEVLYRHTFSNELRISPEEHPVLSTETPLNPISNREKMTQVMFETFNIPTFNLSVQSELSLLSTGRTTGIVLDSGGGSTCSVPIFEGCSICHAIDRRNTGGEDLTNYLGELLGYRGCFFTTSSERECIRDMKEKLCYVALDFRQEVNLHNKTNSRENSYELPDGNLLTIGSERFQASEAMFWPTGLNVETTGIPAQTVNSIRMCDPYIRKYLYENIVLSGGNTLFPGMLERMKRDIESMTPPSQAVKVIAPENKYSAWLGGSLLASLSTFPRWCISKQEWEETGPTIVRRMIS